MRRKTAHNLLVMATILGIIFTGIGMVFVTIEHLWITICLILCVVSIIALDHHTHNEKGGLDE